MIVFWFMSVVLLLLASLALVIPIVRNRGGAEADRDELNKQLYRQRLKEIERDDSQGIISDNAAVIKELQQNLLEDVQESKKAQFGASKLIWLPGVLVLVMISYTVYFKVGGASEVAHWQAVVEKYPELQRKIVMGAGESPTDQDVREFALGLRTQLISTPNDTTGWLMLGRLALALKDAQMALDALAIAYEQAPERTDIRTSYAQALMQSGDPLRSKQAENIIVATIGVEPDNLEAWSLYAFMALQEENFGEAINRWQKMLPMIEKGSERYQMITGSIEYAKSQMEAQKPGKSVGPEYSIEVRLADNVSLPDSGFLFVFAQMIDGPPAPLAAKKIPLPQFPLTVTLSDADAMVPELRLSQQGQFVVKARISLDGNVTPMSGEWEGDSGVIKAGKQGPIQIEVNKAL